MSYVFIIAVFFGIRNVFLNKKRHPACVLQTECPFCFILSSYLLDLYVGFVRLRANNNNEKAEPIAIPVTASFSL